MPGPISDSYKGPDGGFDSECLRLAEYFVQDESGEIRRKVRDLAQTIQNAVEDWLGVEYSESDGDCNARDV